MVRNAVSRNGYDDYKYVTLNMFSLFRFIIFLRNVYINFLTEIKEL